VTLPQGTEKRRVVEEMFDRIAPRYDVMNGLISLGTHRRWKRLAVDALGVAPGSCVLDLACGTGDLLEEIDRVGAYGVGVDVSAGMLTAARRRGVPGMLVRASGDAMPLPTASVDGVVCGFALRNFVAIDDVLHEVARVLRQGARAAFLEVDRPTTPLLTGAHRLYFERVVPLVGGLLSDRSAYRYLPNSAAYLPDEDTLSALFVDAGFEPPEKRRLMMGAAQLVVSRRGGRPC